MAFPKSPPKFVQQRLLAESLHGQSSSTDHWEYAVAHDWFKQYVHKISENNSTPIEMLPLYIVPDNAGNTFIGESQWKILVSWYGLADDSSLLRRPKFSDYVAVALPSNQEHIFADKDLDFLPVSIGRLEQLDTPEHFHYVQIYFWEQFSFLELMARRKLNVPSTSNVRMWISLAEKDRDVFFKNIDPCLLSWFSCLGSLICAENMFVLDELRQRQATMQGLPPTEQEFSSSPSTKGQTQLDDIFDKHGIVITICIEELPPKMTEISAFEHQESSIFGEVTPFVRTAAKSQSEWDVALTEGLEQLNLGISEAVKKNTSLLCNQAKHIVSERVQTLEDQKAELDEIEKSLKAKERKLYSFEKDLNERDEDLNLKVSKFKQNLTDFLTQKKKLEEELRRLEEQNKKSVSRVELNIGGARYTTSATTLMREEDSILASMFNGRNAVHQEKDGSYFIDRDGTNFRYILNFLREGASAVESFPTEISFLNELFIEAKYYNLVSLTTTLQAKIQALSRGKSH